jgi:hypothetical protein
MANSKQKGNSFERVVANLLSERFAQFLGVEKGFRRNADSGSYFGGKNQQRISTHDVSHQNFGDILCPKNFKYSIECKHYKTPVSLNSILCQNSKQINDWIKQAETDAQNASKLPMLVIKYDNTEPMLLIKENLREHNIKYQEYFVYVFKQILNQNDLETKWFD